MIDKTNFFLQTAGVWEELEKVPSEFVHIFSSPDGSEYFLSKYETFVIRVSNHWGSGIGQCNWYINGYQRRNAFKWTEVVGENPTRIGIIAFKDLKDITV